MSYDNWVIPFGKYKFTALCRVPANYLLGLYGDNGVMQIHPEIKAFIEANKEKLIENQDKGDTAEDFRLPCDKIAFLSEEFAKEQLKLVRKDNRDHKKPIRAYYCNKCGLWHLTSKSLIIPRPS
jgi:hypothetical protein